MADQNGLQLLPETRKRIDVSVPGENRLVYAGIAALFLAAVLIIGLSTYSRSLENKVNDINSSLTNLEQQRDKKAEQNVLVLSKQLTLISQILNNHVIWTNALGTIGELLKGQVQFVSFSGDYQEGKVDLKALAANYTTLAKQIASFNSNNSITNMGLSNVRTLTNGRLEFNMRLDFDKDKFVK